MENNSKKRKIGILTYHREVNEGAFLQLLGVYTLLKKKYPLSDIEIIDYRPLRLEYLIFRRVLKKKFPFFSFGEILKIFEHRKYLKDFKLTKKKIVTNNYNKAVKYINSLNLDTIFVGSDEVWSLKNTGFFLNPPNIYWMGDGIKAKINAISPSANKTRIEKIEKNIDILKSQINSFDNISVRDDYTKKIIQKYLTADNKKIIKLPDPTFAWDIKKTNISQKIYSGNIKKKDLLICISVSNIKLANKIAQYFENTKFKIICLLEPSIHAHKNLKGKLSVYEWADSYRFFDFVITDRFHSSVFSLRNLTPFLVLDHDINYKNAESKTINLLREFKIDKNIINMHEEDINKKMFFAKIRKIKLTYSKKDIKKTCIENKKKLFDYIKNIGGI